MTEGKRRSLALLCLGLILALHALAMGAYHVPVLANSDANGYHVCAKMLQQHGRCYQDAKDELSFLGEMWVVTDEGSIYPKYPPLYPAISAVVMTLFGDRAGLAVSPAFCWLAVLGAYVLSRALMSRGASLLVTWVVATSPVLCSLGVLPHSHAVSVGLLTWGYALFFHARRRVGRLALAMFVGAGLLIGYSAGVRYTNVLLALPPLLWLALRLKQRGWAAAIAFGVGLAVPYAGMACYHWAAFGSPVKTAYSLTLEQSAFGLSHFVRHLRLYPTAMVTHLLGPVFLLSCCGFVAAWVRGWRRGLFYTLWIVPLALVYMAYYWVIARHPVSFMRFYLPLVLPCTLLGVVFARDVLAALDFSAAAKRWLIVAVVLCQTGWAVPTTVYELESRQGPNARILREVDFIRASVPHGATVFAELLSLDSLDYRQEYRLYWRELLQQDDLRTLLVGSGALGKGPDAMQHDRAQWFKEHFLDVPEPEFIRLIRELIDARIAAGGGVYLIGPVEQREAFVRAYSSWYDLESAGVLPAAPASYVLFSPGKTKAPDATYIDRITPK